MVILCDKPFENNDKEWLTTEQSRALYKISRDQVIESVMGEYPGMTPSAIWAEHKDELAKRIDLNTIREIVTINYPDMRRMIKSLRFNWKRNNGSIAGSAGKIGDSEMKAIHAKLIAGDWWEARLLYLNGAQEHKTFIRSYYRYSLENTPKQLGIALTKIFGQSNVDSALDIDQELGIATLLAKLAEFYDRLPKKA